MEIPALPQYDELLLRNAPPELLRGRLKETNAWLNDSGSVGAPSDILVEHERGERGERGGRYYPPPLGEFNKLSLLDVAQPEPGYHHTYSEAGPGSQGSRRSFYGGCGYSREYFRNLSGDHLAPIGHPQTPGGSPNKTGLSGLSSPRNLLHPSGSPASEASKSPQRSPRSQRQGMWNFRSFQNPIGSVYHNPEDTEWSWGGRGGGEERGEDRAEEDRAWAGRNLQPYESLSGVWMRPGDGYYVSNRSPPLYTSVRSPTNLTSLAPFLPRPGPSQHLPPSHLYPAPPITRRDGPPAKPSSRPYSADVGRLLSVQENSELPAEERGGSSRSKAGHRRSSSYGSTSEMAAQVRFPETERIRHGYSYSDIQDWPCEYPLLSPLSPHISVLHSPVKPGWPPFISPATLAMIDGVLCGGKCESVLEIFP